MVKASSGRSWWLSVWIGIIVESVSTLIVLCLGLFAVCNDTCIPTFGDFSQHVFLPFLTYGAFHHGLRKNVGKDVGYTGRGVPGLCSSPEMKFTPHFAFIEWSIKFSYSAGVVDLNESAGFCSAHPASKKKPTLKTHLKDLWTGGYSRAPLQSPHVITFSF